MAEEGQFNTDASALRNRIKAHDKFALKDINEWIFEALDVQKGHTILDIGCGIGKQTIPLAKVVGQSGHVYAFDISAQGLQAVKEQAIQLNISKQITTFQGEIDKIGDYFVGKTFDRILSCYSLYYTTKAQDVFSAIYKSIANGGIFFCCGPAKSNNLELREFHFQVKDGRKTPPETSAGLFMEETGIQLARKHFGNIEVRYFENPLDFDSAQALYDYWSSYNLYEKELETKFMEFANKHFQSNKIFRTVKRVVGITASKN